MFVIAGPPGGGKSSVFSLSDSGVQDFFNADDRAAQLNGGSYRNISPEIRAITNREFEQFIASHTRDRKDFAFETTLRSTITFEQAARDQGFEVSMRFVALRNAEMHIARVIARAESGGHSASPERIRAIYEASLRNLRRALANFENVSVYDNSATTGIGPQLVLRTLDRCPTFLTLRAPRWLNDALRTIAYHLDRVRLELDSEIGLSL